MNKNDLLARRLCSYSLNVKPNDNVLIDTTDVDVMMMLPMETHQQSIGI